MIESDAPSPLDYWREHFLFHLRPRPPKTTNLTYRKVSRKCHVACDPNALVHEFKHVTDGGERQKEAVWRDERTELEERAHSGKNFGNLEGDGVKMDERKIYYYYFPLEGLDAINGRFSQISKSWGVSQTSWKNV